MQTRLLFACITLFWLTMNFLLYREEFASDKSLGSPVPPEVVWTRILTAPDDSSLAILSKGKRLGFVRWTPTVTEEPALTPIPDDGSVPEGMVKRTTGFTVDLDGNFALQDTGSARLRFGLHAEFTTNQSWRNLELRTTLRPNQWLLKASNETEDLTVKVEEEGGSWEKRWTFKELQNPAALLSQIGGPALLPLLPLLNTLPSQVSSNTSSNANPNITPPQLSLGLAWEARTDWLKIGRARARVYRLSAKIIDRYRIDLLVSRVGEILRVDLPGEVVLANEAIYNH